MPHADAGRAGRTGQPVSTLDNHQTTTGHAPGTHRPDTTYKHTHIGSHRHILTICADLPPVVALRRTLHRPVGSL